MQKPPAPVADVYCRAFREGLGWSDVLREAVVARSTWLRMLNGAGYRSSTVDRLNAAVDKLAGPPDPATAPATHEQEQPHHGG